MTFLWVGMFALSGYLTVAGLLALGIGRAVHIADQRTPTFEQAADEACALTDPIPYTPVDESLVWSARDMAAFREWAAR